MGAVARVVVPENGNFSAFAEELEGKIAQADASISATAETSRVSEFNSLPAGGEAEIDFTCYSVLSLALEMCEFTEGYYNPAVYHSVAAYNFPQSVPPESLPDSETLAAFTSLSSHFTEIELREEGGKYYAKKPDCTVRAGGNDYTLAIDLGGIGKGWCADAADKLMSDYGFSCGYFDFSSSSMSLKSYSGGDGLYELKLCDPRDRSKSFCSLRVRDVNLSTTGDYEHFYEVDGVRYCHIIDPFTGAPIRTGISSVTVIGGSAAEDDALTTALACMGRDKAVEFTEKKLGDKIVIMLVEIGDSYGIITNRPSEILSATFPILSTVENGRIVLKDVT